MCAGAAGLCEKNLAPARPEPSPYPPAVLGKAPPVRFGRSVDANGARPVKAFTAAPTRDFGREALETRPPALAPLVLNWRLEALIAL